MSVEYRASMLHGDTIGMDDLRSCMPRGTYLTVSEASPSKAALSSPEGIEAQLEVDADGLYLAFHAADAQQRRLVVGSIERGFRGSISPFTEI